MKIKFDACIYKMQLIDHDIIKDRLLKLINETPYQETIKDKNDPSTKWGSHITRCDWCYNDKKDRDWYKLFYPNFELSVKKLMRDSNYDCPLDVEDVWFQQYEKNDSHGWHIHRSQFTGVYYLEFPRGSAQTEIVSPFSNKKKKVNVKEGDIIIFPSLWIHRATHNKDKRKTIISFNFNLNMTKCAIEDDYGGISHFD